MLLRGTAAASMREWKMPLTCRSSSTHRRAATTAFAGVAQLADEVCCEIGGAQEPPPPGASAATECRTQQRRHCCTAARPTAPPRAAHPASQRRQRGHEVVVSQRHHRTCPVCRLRRKHRQPRDAISIFRSVTLNGLPVRLVSVCRLLRGSANTGRTTFVDRCVGIHLDSIEHRRQ